MTTSTTDGSIDLARQIDRQVFDRNLVQRIMIDLEIMDIRDRSGVPLSAAEILVTIERSHYRRLLELARDQLRQQIGAP